MTNDMGPAIAPKSDQTNADDLIGGPITVTIKSARVVPDSEQPAILELVERPGRPYKPGRSMSRVLVAAWGPDSSQYVGKRLTLYRDPNVSFGGILVGGIRISHMSDIPKRLDLPLTTTRGRKSMFSVLPLAAPAPQSQSAVTPEMVAACTDETQLRGWWETGTPDLRTLINSRVAFLRDPARDASSPFEGGGDQ